MALPQCSCPVRSIAPASCLCVFSGNYGILPVTCSKCGYEDLARWPKSSGRPWSALVLSCPHCRHGSCVSFAGLPEAAKLQIEAANSRKA